MKELQLAILRTLAYADIFDYPLKIEEIWKYLIAEKKVSFPKIKEELRCKPNLISQHGDYFFLKNRGKIVEIRKKREKWSQKKLKIAQRVATWLRLIPTIKMVGVSGALAMNNADRNDDIDLLIVSTKGRLWLTRMLVVILVELVARRRRPGDTDIKNKICLNMFLDEAHLQVPKKERDLFSAHEVVQLKLLWDRNNVYQQFLGKNQWVKKYLPNAINFKTKNLKLKTPTQNLKFLEILARRFQFWYMKKRRTTEKISKGFVRFHPQDCRRWILAEYNKRLGKISS